ncbi:DHH family protein [Protomyces lactucae-debilis]|uniref:DHH family protein n=1 Tax=Protomyces lactucae-debilis TaxID=2754530 RepID=A0A1Y2EWD9_PROLT|nr:DHH family protein [Protomyces lactucae-debilis]ORY75817.1 DHH family protein [Protomyces lactucae-debilis]
MKRSIEDDSDVDSCLKRDRQEWPAAEAAMAAARSFIEDAAKTNGSVLLCPDKDADGLSAGVIMYRTLTRLGLDPSQIQVHLLSKGTSLFSETERSSISQKAPGHIIVLDQGSCRAPALLHGVPTLILDHHYSTAFPDDAVICSAALHEPIATTALLTYELCSAYWSDAIDGIGYLAVIGTVGDLGASVKWTAPFPSHLGLLAKELGRKNFTDAVGLINAPRRSSAYNVSEAWLSLLTTEAPSQILHFSTNVHLGSLVTARDEVADEVDRVGRTAPLWSQDKRTACFVISSPCQVHPLVATRWCFLHSKDLEVVMCANKGYMKGKVHFSCRIPKHRRKDDGTANAVNLQEILKGYAKLDDELWNKLRIGQGGSFAQGHREASGGVLDLATWDMLYAAMGIGQATRRKVNQPVPVQRNTLTNYFGKLDANTTAEAVTSDVPGEDLRAP